MNLITYSSPCRAKLDALVLEAFDVFPTVFDILVPVVKWEKWSGEGLTQPTITPEERLFSLVEAELSAEAALCCRRYNTGGHSFAKENGVLTGKYELAVFSGATVTFLGSIKQDNPWQFKVSTQIEFARRSVTGKSLERYGWTWVKESSTK